MALWITKPHVMIKIKEKGTIDNQSNRLMQLDLNINMSHTFFTPLDYLRSLISGETLFAALKHQWLNKKHLKNHFQNICIADS